jgi:hypothetical protein
MHDRGRSYRVLLRGGSTNAVLLLSRDKTGGEKQENNRWHIRADFRMVWWRSISLGTQLEEDPSERTDLILSLIALLHCLIATP